MLINKLKYIIDYFYHYYYYYLIIVYISIKQTKEQNRIRKKKNFFLDK